MTVSPLRGALLIAPIVILSGSALVIIRNIISGATSPDEVPGMSVLAGLLIFVGFGFGLSLWRAVANHRRLDAANAPPPTRAKTR
jgi:hypothetical protein